PLEPLKVAIHSPTWGDGSAAVLGTFGTGPSTAIGLWVPAGRQTLKLSWSAAGTSVAGDRQFELRLPHCSAAALDLQLPADRVPSASADVLLTGPFPASDPQSRTWKFRFGDRPRIDFIIRGPGDGSGIVVASQFAKYDLAAGQIGCTFEWDLRVGRGSVSDWVFELGPGVTVVDAVVNDRAGWRVDTAAHQLRVALRQPASAGKVVVTATAPLPPNGQNAALPVVRALNSIQKDERIDIRV